MIPEAQNKGICYSPLVKYENVCLFQKKLAFCGKFSHLFCKNADFLEKIPNFKILQNS